MRAPPEIAMNIESLSNASPFHQCQGSFLSPNIENNISMLPIATTPFSRAL